MRVTGKVLTFRCEEFHMKRFPSVKKNGEFQKIYRGGTSHANRLLVMYVMKNGEESKDWHLGEQESGQQRCPPSYHKTVAGDISFE